MNIISGIIIWIVGNVLNLTYTSSVPRANYGELKLFGAPATYSVDTTVLLNDASRKDKEVGYKVTASLDLAPVWSNGDSEHLLKFDLLAPRRLERSAGASAAFAPGGSVWDARPRSSFYAHWSAGRVRAAYLNAAEPDDVLDFQKSLISLFQFQVIDGEHNETDFSGTCRVSYETISVQSIRKIKRECRVAEGDGGVGEAEGEGGAESRRVVRYTLSAALDALQELHAEEVHVLGDAADGAALKARAWQRLERAPAAPAAAAAHATLAAALDALPAALTPHALRAGGRAPPLDEHDDTDAGAALAAAAGALAAAAPGAGGDAAAARALLRALPAAARAPRDALLAALHAQRDPHALAALCRLAGLAATAAAHGAAAAFLRPEGVAGDGGPEELAREYLGGLAQAPRPSAEAVLGALRLAEGARGAWAVRAGALHAAAAAAPRAPPSAEVAVRDHLLRSLARCKEQGEEEEGCLVPRLEALGNLRRADTADALLAAAERTARAPAGAAALAALGALGSLPAAALQRAAPLGRLEALARGARTLAVRAAALDLLLRRAAATGAPGPLEHAAHALHAPLAPAPAELRRVFWQRALALAPEHSAVRLMLRALPPRVAGWHARAAPGTSSVLRREAGAAGARRALLDSLQLASGGLLRRGRVELLTLDAANRTEEAFAVELWTRGLDALAGGAEGGPEDIADEEAEEAGGGLALAVGGARLPGITLFGSQAELLGHVWAGRGSEPTSVARALRPLRETGGLVPLAGGGALRWRRRVAIAYALDASAQVSLWSRSARARLQLRAALAADCEARAGPLVARAALDSEPRLTIGADLDFYRGPTLCVRVSVAAHERRTAAELRSPRLRRTRSVVAPAPGRTLALGAPNDAACRTLGSADGDDI